MIHNWPHFLIIYHINALHIAINVKPNQWTILNVHWPCRQLWRKTQFLKITDWKPLLPFTLKILKVSRELSFISYCLHSVLSQWAIGALFCDGCRRWNLLDFVVLGMGNNTMKIILHGEKCVKFWFMKNSRRFKTFLSHELCFTSQYSTCILTANLTIFIGPSSNEQK